MSTERTTVKAIVGPVAGLAVGSGLAFAAHLAGNDDLARGVLTGAMVAIIAIMVLTLIGKRGGTLGNIASGRADERERRLKRESLADTGMVVTLAAAVLTIAAAYGISAITLGGTITWIAVLTFAVSFAIRSRRS